MSDISAALCVVITVSTNTAHLCNILYTMGPLTLCSNFDLSEVTHTHIIISINNCRLIGTCVNFCKIDCYLLKLSPLFKCSVLNRLYVFWLGCSMCYAARVQILLASVDIRISTEYISSSQAHHITQHLALSLHSPPQCRLLMLISNWTNQYYANFEQTLIDDVLMLNKCYYVKCVFCIYLVLLEFST